MAKLFANSGDADQTPHSAASDLRLHCLPITLLLVSRLQWVNITRSEGIAEYNVSLTEDNGEAKNVKIWKSLWLFNYIE